MGHCEKTLSTLVVVANRFYLRITCCSFTFRILNRYANAPFDMDVRLILSKIISYHKKIEYCHLKEYAFIC